MIGQDVHMAAEILRNGGLVSIPTETVYGLAANGFNAEAVTKIFEAKNRPSFDPVILHISNLDQLDKLVALKSPKSLHLAEKFWPGPLTMILPKSHLVADIVTSGLPFVGIRMPKHPILQSLFTEINFPLAAPSANPFGMVSPTTAQHVEDQLGDKIDYILDGGPCEVGVESTIIGLQQEEYPKILRLGAITQEQIEACIGSVGLEITASSNPQAPGQLDRHYATKKAMKIVDDITVKPENTFVIGIGKDANSTFDINLSPTGDLAEAARNLFAALRYGDASASEKILAMRVEDTGIGRAINDRLKRAEHSG